MKKTKCKCDCHILIGGSGNPCPTCIKEECWKKTELEEEKLMIKDYLDLARKEGRKQALEYFIKELIESKNKYGLDWCETLFINHIKKSMGEGE
jgi:hypothetical protein